MNAFILTPSEEAGSNPPGQEPHPETQKNSVEYNLDKKGLKTVLT